MSVWLLCPIRIWKKSDIFISFWNTGDYDRGLVKETKIERSTVKDPVSCKTHTLSYKVVHSHVEYSVCRAASLSIHGVSERRVCNVLSKCTSTQCTNDDKWGTDPCTRKIGDSLEKLVLQHINCIPAVSSYYTCAKSPHRKYLDTGLNVNKLWVLYCQWLTEYCGDEQPVSRAYYRQVFCNEFKMEKWLIQ